MFLTSNYSLSSHWESPTWCPRCTYFFCPTDTGGNDPRNGCEEGPGDGRGAGGETPDGGLGPP